MSTTMYSPSLASLSSTLTIWNGLGGVIGAPVPSTALNGAFVQAGWSVQARSESELFRLR